MYTYNAALVVVGIALSGSGVGLAEESIGYGVGRPATVAEVQASDIDITPTGAGLPPGREPGYRAQQSMPPSARPAMARPGSKGRRIV